MVWPDSKVYIGEFFAGKRFGKGALKWPNNRIYIGNWLNSKQHGIGTFVNSDGDMKKGAWINGKRVRWYTNPGCQKNSTNTYKETLESSHFTFKEEENLIKEYFGELKLNK